jgi:hypothetical protein
VVFSRSTPGPMHMPSMRDCTTSPVLDQPRAPLDRRAYCADLQRRHCPRARWVKYGRRMCRRGQCGRSSCSRECYRLWARRHWRKLGRVVQRSPPQWFLRVTTQAGLADVDISAAESALGRKLTAGGYVWFAARHWSSRRHLHLLVWGTPQPPVGEMWRACLPGCPIAEEERDEDGVPSVEGPGPTCYCQPVEDAGGASKYVLGLTREGPSGLPPGGWRGRVVTCSQGLWQQLPGSPCGAGKNMIGPAPFK